MQSISCFNSSLPSPSPSLKISKTPIFLPLQLQMDPWPQCSAWKANLPIKALNLLSKSILWIFSSTSEPHPLFSAAAGAGVVAFLYIPCWLLSFFISPVFFITLFLLFTLLRFRSPPQSEEEEAYSKIVKLPPEKPPKIEKCLFSYQKQDFFESSLEWGGWGGPLEIIYEEYEGEEDESSELSPEYYKFGLMGFEGFCYSDSDMEVGSPESFTFRCEEEAEELIEIALEEDHMFEIDLSGCR